MTYKYRKSITIRGQTKDNLIKSIESRHDLDDKFSGWDEFMQYITKCIENQTI